MSCGRIKQRGIKVCIEERSKKTKRYKKTNKLAVKTQKISKDRDSLCHNYDEERKEKEKETLTQAGGEKRREDEKKKRKTVCQFLCKPKKQTSIRTTKEKRTKEKV